MYAIYKRKCDGGSHRMSRRAFDSYDAARNYARTLLRKTNWYQLVGARHNNPNLAEFDVFIKRV